MVPRMTAPRTSHPAVSADFVARLADRAGEAEKQRRLPTATIADYRDSGLARLLLPKRYGGCQAEFPEILEVVRLMAHGCTSSAWTLGFYTLHNWMLALFGERAQDEVFVDGPVLCPAPLAPTGRATPADGGVRLTLQAKAMGGASVGQSVQLQNVSSKKIIQAVATGPGQAVVGPEAEQIKAAARLSPNPQSLPYLAQR